MSHVYKTVCFYAFVVQKRTSKHHNKLFELMRYSLLGGLCCIYMKEVFTVLACTLPRPHEPCSVQFSMFCIWKCKLYKIENIYMHVFAIPSNFFFVVQYGKLLILSSYFRYPWDTTNKLEAGLPVFRNNKERNKGNKRHIQRKTKSIVKNLANLFRCNLAEPNLYAVSKVCCTVLSTLNCFWQ